MWSLEAVINRNNWKQKNFLHWAAEQNLNYVELLSYYMNRENNQQEIKTELNRLGLQLSCYTILSDFTDESAYTKAEFKKDLDTAATLGAPFVRVLTGDKTGSERDRLILIKKLSAAVAEAEKRNITLILENIGPFAGKTGDAASIIEAINSPCLRINFDTANSLLADESPEVAVDILLPYISYIHLKDFITEKSGAFQEYSSEAWRIQTSRKGVRMTGIAAGKGDAGLPKVMKKLKNYGYDGFISIEYENDLNAEEAVTDSLLFIKTI